jgi:lipopolysaccharide biosynthesis protein
MSKKKVFANYLPGFHTDEYNNKWWGKDFTEWENVKNCSPLFIEHNQPKIPKLGYLDLSKYDDLKKQVQLAKLYDITGFFIYNYWYDGVQILNKPIDIILENKELEIEFAICWANHDWTRSWTNRAGALDTLICQNYDINVNCYKHAKYLASFFSDIRYLTINERPVLQVYDLCKNSESYLIELKNILLNEFDFDVYLIQTLRSKSEIKSSLANAFVYFQPSFSLKRDVNLIDSLINLTNIMPTFVKKYLYRLYDLMPDAPTSLDYNSICDNIIDEYRSPVPNSILAMFVDFDNTPRYKNRARYFRNFSLEKFSQTLESFLKLRSLGNIYIINAWNEWGEGMFLEPDEQFGSKKLEIVKNAIDKNI